MKLHKFTEARLQFHGIEAKQSTSKVGSQKILQLQQNSKHETIPKLAGNKLQSRALYASKSNLSFANVLSKKWHLFSSSACTLTSPLLVPHSTQMLAISNKILMWWSRDFHLEMLKSYKTCNMRTMQYMKCVIYNWIIQLIMGMETMFPFDHVILLPFKYRLEISKLN